MDLSTIFTSPALWNGFWVFVGVAAGSLIQYMFHQLVQRQQRRNAKIIFRAEIEINQRELEAFENRVKKQKERFSANQLTDSDFYFDMRHFNYRIVDPLINTGWFHQFLGANGVKSYFGVMNDLNVNSARNLSDMLREGHHSGKSLEFLDWILDVKIPEWRKILTEIAQKLK